MLRLPGWLAFIIFVPLQIWFFLELRAVWGVWWTIGFFIVLGFLGNRAARAPWLRELLFPHSARRWEERRHVFQGILFLLAAGSWLLPTVATQLPPALAAWAAGWPQPWLPLAYLVTLLKATLR